jgi:hypothetical protein
MPFQRKFYPPEWDALHKLRIEQVGRRCEQCGVPDRTVLYNPKKVSEYWPEGEPYMVYLSQAHKHQYQTWIFDAETMMLCQACHRKFDRQFRRKKVVRYEPIGVVLVRVWYRGRWTLAADAHWLHDLLDVVLSLPVGTEFELLLDVMTCRVGSGRYCKEAGGVLVRREKGACRVLGELLSSDGLERVCV